MINDILQIIDKLPGLALWICVLLLIHKIVIVGSIYGLCRYAIRMAHDTYKMYSQRPIKKFIRIREKQYPLKSTITEFYVDKLFSAMSHKCEHGEITCEYLDNLADEIKKS